MVASSWHEVTKGTLQGFFDLRLSSGLRLHGCSLHAKGPSRWIGFPGVPQLDETGRVKFGADGKRIYTPAVSIPSSERREAFQAQALAAVDRLLGSEP
jgi:hypothetical protein